MSEISYEYSLKVSKKGTSYLFVAPELGCHTKGEDPVQTFNNLHTEIESVQRLFEEFHLTPENSEMTQPRFWPHFNSLLKGVLLLILIGLLILIPLAVYHISPRVNAYIEFTNQRLAQAEENVYNLLTDTRLLVGNTDKLIGEARDTNSQLVETMGEGRVILREVRDDINQKLKLFLETLPTTTTTTVDTTGGGCYGDYVRSYPDLLAAYKASGGGQSIGDWGKSHYEGSGLAEGRAVAGCW